MPTLKNIFLSILLLTASRVTGNSTTTVTLFNAEETGATTGGLIDVSAINVESNGGTAYVEKVGFTITSSGGSPITTTQTLTIVEAESWLYLSIQATSGAITGSVTENCTFGANGTAAECIDIANAAASWGTTTITTSYSAQVVPFATVTVTGPIPKKSIAAATIVDNPIFNRLPSFFGGILFIMMFLS